jgi:hypothetical protein
MCGNSSSRNAGCEVDVLAQPQDFRARIVVIGEHPGRRLDFHILETPRVEQAARHFRPGDATVGPDVRVFSHVGLDTPLSIRAQEKAWQDEHPK